MSKIKEAELRHGGLHKFSEKPMNGHTVPLPWEEKSEEEIIQDEADKEELERLKRFQDD